MNTVELYWSVSNAVFFVDWGKNRDISNVLIKWPAISLRCISRTDYSSLQLRKKYSSKYNSTHSIYMLCSSLSSKHWQNPCSTSHIKNNLITKQVSVIVHCIPVCCCAHFIFDHFLLNVKKKILLNVHLSWGTSQLITFMYVTLHLKMMHAMILK